MRIRLGSWRAILLFAVVFLSSCGNNSAVEYGSSPRDAELPIEFPYHPVVFHLDLSVLAYQVHANTFVWPFDPFYEVSAGDREVRPEKLSSIRDWAKMDGRAYSSQSREPDGFRGPGLLNGFEDNPTHDPIIYEYSQVYPWRKALVYSGLKWTEYAAPREITANIQSVHVCFRERGASRNQVAFKSIATRPGSVSSTGDTLLVFEGGTGDKGEPGRPESQSLMGLILVRDRPGGGYDVHVAFRGSRSGRVERAALQAFSDSDAKGNPDWITDLGYNRLAPDEGGALVSSVGEVHRGFAQSMRSTMPNLIYCLDRVADRKRGEAPQNIFVTGHSLGGAMAQVFASSMLQGARFGPMGQGGFTPVSLRSWPWQSLKLVTFSAPRVGDEVFARTLTEQVFQTDFFSTLFRSTDPDAIEVTDPTVIKRLMDPRRPVAFRILDSRDPITTQKVAGGKHVGKTIYADGRRSVGLITLPRGASHEPANVRKLLVAEIQDPRIPAPPMRFPAMAEVYPDHDTAEIGTRDEIIGLAGAITKFYADRGLVYDLEKHERNLRTYLELVAEHQAASAFPGTLQ
jgi:hypothetical protein